VRWIKRFLLILVGFYLIAALAVYLLQRNFIYFPNKNPAPEGFTEQFNLEVIRVAVDEVGEITSYYSAPIDEQPVILFFHGNGGNAYERTAQFQDFQNWQVGFLASEYPGYSENPGPMTETTFFASALAHFDWLVKSGVDPENIVIYGHSLGAASAVHVASERESAGLVLTAPFLSAVSMAQLRMPYFPAGFLLKDRFRSDLKMPKVEEPLLILHGNRDREIPIEMGRQLTALHTGDARFIMIEGARHYMWQKGMTDHIREAVFKYTSASVQ
jgi:pimeloyl-ACP methyl ester carboxylesterase